MTPAPGNQIVLQGKPTPDPDPPHIAAAKNILRQKYTPVYRASVNGGPKDEWIVGHRRMSTGDMLDLAARLTLEKRAKPAAAKPERRFEAVKPQPEKVRALADDHPAMREMRTIFPTTVVDPADSPRLFVSGKNSRKLGSHVAKGPWRGMPIYSLTLEERATCPPSCHHLGDCYGNSMHLARRHRHGPELEKRLVEELGELAKAHRKGFVIRLHVLGDFYSENYVDIWGCAVAAIENLHVFGYTAHGPSTPTGKKIAELNDMYPFRWKVRFSVPDLTGIEEGATITVKSRGEAEAKKAILCPAQTGETDCCGTCGLCWSRMAWQKPIAFLLHGNPWTGRPPGRKGAEMVNRPISQEKIDRIKALRKQGMSLRRISEEVRCGKNTVERYLEKDEKCGCGRPASHMGRCWFRRGWDGPPNSRKRKAPAAPEQNAREPETPPLHKQAHKPAPETGQSKSLLSRYIDDLLETGIYGDTRQQVKVNLVRQGVQRAVEQGVIKPRRRGDG